MWLCSAGQNLFASKLAKRSGPGITKAKTTSISDDCRWRQCSDTRPSRKIRIRTLGPMVRTRGMFKNLRRWRSSRKTPLQVGILRSNSSSKDVCLYSPQALMHTSSCPISNLMRFQGEMYWSLSAVCVMQCGRLSSWFQRFSSRTMFTAK